MKKQRILILDKERINRKLQRMAYQIWEYNSNESCVTLVGIEGSGAVVAKSLMQRLQEISPLKIKLVLIKMNKKQPLTDEIQIKENLSDCSVVLVDDVANSGKTLLHALKPLLSFELKKIMIAVLVDRKHKSFPVSPDIVGHSVSTTLQEHIEVESNGDEITAAYLQ
ncbi:MAG TPA: phosphoribosyltransferase family protein [Flavipsychrobacter sp.]|nr:phosphoribosyltransferase family protein [Flavipsychrobacter sp.]